MDGAALPSAVSFGKYQLIERLGRGGMAEVWKARVFGPAGFSRTLVVKRILPQLADAEQFVKQFTTEARLCAQLSHANIVQVYEFGEVDGEYFIAMEYVRGRDLSSIMRALRESGRMIPIGLGVLAVREVCRALAYAHSLTDDTSRPLKLIHRDVSPSNVMLGFDGAVKLVDFGIAKAVTEGAEGTRTGTLKGKFGYMAPEQVEGEAIDHRVDLFAAGIILHELLTGKRLFRGASDVQTLAAVRAARVEPPSKSNPEVSPDLDRICLKALARSPADRYQNGNEMANELDEVVHRLKWGPEQSANLLRDLFPDEPSKTQNPIAPPTEAASPQARKGELLRHSGTGRRLLLAGVLASAAAVAWWLSVRPTGRTRPRSAVAATVAPPSSTHPAAVATPAPSFAPASHPAASRVAISSALAPRTSPQMVTISVQSVPLGAEVFFGNERIPRGRTPLNLKVHRAVGSSTVSLRASGYRPIRIAVLTDRDNEVTATLVRTRHRGRVPSSSTSDVESGVLQNPF